MTRYVVTRIVWLITVMLTASLLTFALGKVAPGDPARLLLQRSMPGQVPTEAQVERMRDRLGLDRPLPVQYVTWLADAVQGDLGTSWATGEPVAETIAERLPRTLVLGAAAAALAVVVAIPLGVLAAYRRETIHDHASRVGSLLGASLPNYFLAYLLIFAFGVKLGLVPVFGFGSFGHLLLPAITLAVGPAAVLTRLTRSTVLDVLRDDYVKTAWSKGLSARVVLFRHVLRNALIPVITAGSLSIAGLLNGAVIVEWIFAWPGVGKLGIDAIYARDFTMIQGFVLLTAIIYVIINFLTDLAYGVLDPRVRVG